jgi:hypothetical protein
MFVGRKKKKMIRENDCCMLLIMFSVIKANIQITGILLIVCIENK